MSDVDVIHNVVCHQHAATAATSLVGCCPLVERGCHWASEAKRERGWHDRGGDRQSALDRLVDF